MSLIFSPQCLSVVVPFRLRRFCLLPMLLQNRALTRNPAFPTGQLVTTPADEMLMKKVGEGGQMFYLQRP
jgi:hypothetical protein